MSLNIKSATDIYMTYRFIRALVTPFDKTDAYEHGIIDADGKPLKKKRNLTSREEKNSYTIYNRLVFKLKRLIGKIPGGKTRLASYAAALWLIKENILEGDSEKAYLLEQEFATHIGIEQEDYELMLESDSSVSPGRYAITNENVSEVFDGVSVGDVVVVESTEPIDCILGISLYSAIHEKTKTRMVVSNEEIQELFI